MPKSRNVLKSKDQVKSDTVSKLDTWRIPILLISALFSCIPALASEPPTSLPDCGRVIGHEMGLWDFFSLNPGPEQVDWVLGSELRFVKVSLQELKDGSWVVDHSDWFAIETPDGDLRSMKYADVTWNDIERLRSEGNSIEVHRLDDYVARDQGRLCWMLSPKESPDDNLVQNLIRLGVQDRTVILTYGIADVKFLASYPESQHLHFAGRVGADPAALQSYVGLTSRLWAMEIDPTPNTRRIIQATHAMGLAAYVDSMKYSWNYELFGTACKTVFRMGADYTQTNRPLECLRDMGASSSPDAMSR